MFKNKRDIEQYMFITVDDMDVYEKMEGFDIREFGSPLTFSWVAPKSIFLESDSGSELLPEITQFNGNDLVVRKDVYEVLFESLDDGCFEAYPLLGYGEEYLLINPIKKLDNDYVDLNKTKMQYYDDGAWDRVEKLVLKSSKIDSAPLLFSLECENGAFLYCKEEFKDFVERNKFKGLIFEEVEEN